MLYLGKKPHQLLPLITVLTLPSFSTQAISTKDRSKNPIPNVIIPLSTESLLQLTNTIPSKATITKPAPAPELPEVIKVNVTNPEEFRVKAFRHVNEALLNIATFDQAMYREVINGRLGFIAVNQVKEFPANRGISLLPHGSTNAVTISFRFLSVLDPKSGKPFETQAIHIQGELCELDPALTSFALFASLKERYLSENTSRYNLTLSGTQREADIVRARTINEAMLKATEGFVEHMCSKAALDDKTKDALRAEQAKVRQRISEAMRILSEAR